MTMLTAIYNCNSNDNSDHINDKNEGNNDNGKAVGEITLLIKKKNLSVDKNAKALALTYALAQTVVHFSLCTVNLGLIIHFGVIILDTILTLTSTPL